ncbi:MAG TPA: hypothetical protein VMU95_42145 [Trebonia sp.]|nr:hypothetical protein [Trebonia sp.]
MIRYLSGLLVCGLGLFGGGWLIVVVVLLRGTPTIASLASLSTGAGVALVSAVGVACWSVAWRQRLRLDGVLAEPVSEIPRGTQAGSAAEGSRGVPAGRSRRALRRDMRHAGRAARRTSRRGEAAELACPPKDEDRQPAIPGPRIPLAAETSGVMARKTDEAQRPGVVLTELRAMLEPLLTTGPLPALDSEPDDGGGWELLGEEESW